MASSFENSEPLQRVHDRELFDRVERLLQKSREIVARSTLLIQQSEDLHQALQRSDSLDNDTLTHSVLLVRLETEN